MICKNHFSCCVLCSYCHMPAKAWSTPPPPPPSPHKNSPQADLCKIQPTTEQSTIISNNTQVRSHLNVRTQKFLIPRRGTSCSTTSPFWFNEFVNPSSHPYCRGIAGQADGTVVWCHRATVHVEGVPAHCAGPVMGTANAVGKAAWRSIGGIRVVGKYRVNAALTRVCGRVARSYCEEWCLLLVSRYVRQVW
jgi:hypothetical protein